MMVDSNMLIHTSWSQRKLPKDLSNTKVKERFYTNKKNLQSLRTKDLCEWKGTTCMWMSKFKGVWACWNGQRPPQTQKWHMADTFIRWSLPHQQRSTTNERFWRRLKPWKSKIKMKTSSNRDDRPLGGDCWDQSFTILSSLGHLM